MANKKTRTTRKKISLSEFKAWLEGVEELHPSDWSPDKDQWKLIRNKIKNIIEDQTTPHSVPGPHAPLPPVHPVKSGMPPTGVPIPPGAPPVTEESLSISPAAAAMLKADNGKTKTPNIDTTDGSYNSTFL